MSYFSVPSGSAVPLNIQLSDGSTSKYPIAHLYNVVTKTAVAGSPFSLGHLANGLYVWDVPGLPVGRYIATFIVYDNLAHTVESATHKRETSYFDISSVAADVSSIKTRVYAIPTNPLRTTDFRLDFLDAPISTRVRTSQLSGLATAASITSLQNNLNVELADIQTGIEPLQNFAALENTVASIKSKTDNLPIDPARESSVKAIPLNPLLVNDPRLNYLDTHISTRVRPSQLSGLATNSKLDSVLLSIDNSTSAIIDEFSPLVTGTQLNAAMAPLAQQVLLQAVKAAIDNLALSSLTADKVWDYSVRTLTAPVNTTLDISALAKSSELAAVEAAIIASLPKSECQLTVSIDPETESMEALAWEVRDGSVLTDRETCAIEIYNSDGAIVASLGPSSSPNDLGVFKLIYNSAGVVLTKNRAYAAKVTITKGAETKVSIKSFTVF